MSNEQPPIEPPNDEPVIGGSIPPTPDPVMPAPDPGPDANGPVIGAPIEDGARTLFPLPDPAPQTSFPPIPAPPSQEPNYPPEPEDYPPIYVQPYGPPPQRSPMFFVLMFLGIVVVGAFLFLLYTLLQDDSGTAGPATPDPTPEIGVVIESPAPEQRFNVNTDGQVTARAQSNEVITEFVLLLDGERFSDESAVPGELTGEYGAVLTIRFEEAGSYDLVVRAISESGATKDSGVVTVIAFDDPDPQPNFLEGEVVASVNLRGGPDESFPKIGVLEPGDIVRATGRTRNSEWIFIDAFGGVWLKRQAVRFTDSPSLLLVLEPTPTPGPGPTEESSPTGSPSPSASPDPDAPDFLPEDAILVVLNDQMHLSVTVKNNSAAPYTGSLVIAVSGVPVSDSQKVFPVDLAGNGTTTLNFPLDEMVGPEGASALVRVDPSNLVEESEEDNNEVEFIVTAPVDQPQISLTPFIQNGTVAVTILNSGGPINEPDAFLSLTLDKDTISTGISLNLNKGESATELIQFFLTGDYPFYELKLLASASGPVIASFVFPNPNAAITPEPTETETPDPTAEETTTS